MAGRDAGRHDHHDRDGNKRRPQPRQPAIHRSYTSIRAHDASSNRALHESAAKRQPGWKKWCALNSNRSVRTRTYSHLRQSAVQTTKLWRKLLRQNLLPARRSGVELSLLVSPHFSIFRGLRAAVNCACRRLPHQKPVNFRPLLPCRLQILQVRQIFGRVGLLDVVHLGVVELVPAGSPS